MFTNSTLKENHRCKGKESNRQENSSTYIINVYLLQTSNKIVRHIWSYLIVIVWQTTNEYRRINYIRTSANTSALVVPEK